MKFFQEVIGDDVQRFQQLFAKTRRKEPKIAEVRKELSNY
jgi:hypothetical protein